MIPAELGDYTIEGLLGEGGSSLVYAARRAGGATEEIALKVLHPDLGLTERETERFLDEARKLKQLSHPGVVSLLASGRLPDGRPFIAMPRLRGSSLGDRLRADPIPTARALALFADLAEAVSALHDAGLLHRDIKPDNVFWLAQEDRLMLLDLGIARDTESSPGTTTRAGLSRGTPEYMAPERLFGQRATVKTDVYELTLLLYVMLARRPPWTEGDAHARLEPKIAPELAEALPAALVSTLRDGLALDVGRRPASVHELMDRIAAATAGTALDVARTARTRVATAADLVGSTLPSAGAAEQGATRLVLTPRGPVPIEQTLGTAPTTLHTPVSPPAPLSEPPSAPMFAPTVAVETTRTSKRGSTAPLVAGALVALAGLGGGFYVMRSRAGAQPSEPAASAPQAGDASAAPPPASTAASSASLPAPSSPAASASVGEAVASAPGASAAASSAIARPAATARASPTTAPSTSRPASEPAAPPSTAVATGAPGPTPPACSALVALMCSPTSGATPDECVAWKGNVEQWVTKNPNNAASTCQAALSAEQNGLQMRKTTPRPQP